MRKINPELLLLLFLVVIAAIFNFLASSQHVTLAFYFLPTLFSAYHFGRRHATYTALASIGIVVLLVRINPAMFNLKLALPFDARWIDITVWGGVLMLAGYATGSLHERNEESLREMQEGYDGMLVILQNFLAGQKYSDAGAYRISICAVKIGEQLGFDAGSIEDIRTAALLFNLEELGVSTEMLRKATQLSQEELQQGRANHKMSSSASAMAGSLRRAIPIFLSEQELRKGILAVGDASFEVQVLHLAEQYEALISGKDGAKIAPSQAREEMLRQSQDRYDSLIVNAFTNAYAAKGAGA